MQWWCSAQGIPWSWTWRPYVGVWLLIAALGVAGWLFTRRTGRTRLQRTSFLTGLLLLWAALDWPIGTLGAGYLASVHMVQFLLIVFYAPPLILLGLRPDEDDATARAGYSRLRRALTHPLVTLAILIVVTIVTHLPVVVDSLMSSQAGSFLLDSAWLIAGLLFWWPVIMPGAPTWFIPVVRIGYFVASMMLMTAPNAMITFSQLPIYATYELAPPIPGIDVLQDQRLAGIWMRLGAAIAVWTAISVLFIRWSRRETRMIDEELDAQRQASGASPQ
jgi:cytochrome c oxidase assembly factor CtaG